MDPDNLDYLQCDGALIENDAHEQNNEHQPVKEQKSEPNPKSDKPKKETDAPIMKNTGCTSLGEDDPADMKILVIYTQAALDDAGNQATMDNRIAQAITRANVASMNSGLGMNFILAHSELTTYVESGNSGTDLTRLRGKTDGFMDNVHTLRNTHAADFVHLITFVTDTGGIANLLNNRNGREDIAFGITRVQQLSWTNTLVHEVGHNMGASHAKGQTTQAGPTNWSNWPENTWSAGSRFQGDDTNYYCSLMTYGNASFWPDGIGSQEINYFSTPLLNYQGQPIGDAVDADNVRSLKDVKQIVSKYRDENTLLYCAANGNNASTSNFSITNVNINTLNNSSTWAQYTDYSFMRTCLTKGLTYPFTVNVGGGHASNELLIWIDYNNNNDFTDPGELVYSSGIGNTLQYSSNFTPPASAVTGEVRMRIRYNYTQSGGNSTPCGTSQFGEVEDYTVVLLEPENCSSTSVPDNITANDITATTASLFWSSYTNAVYDLRYKESGTTTWTEIEDIPQSNTTITGLNLLTEYEVQIRSQCTDGTLTDYSASVLFTTVDIIYCNSQGNIQADEFISRVQFVSIDNTSAADNGGYSDFTSISTVVKRGDANTITITPTWTGGTFNEGYAVWIDLNQDGDFTDAGELVFSQTPTTANPVSGSITIPSTALIGKTRMRVSMKWNAIPTSCETFQYGEVEDYTLVIYDDYVHYENAWTPSNPSNGVSLSTENILVVNGETSLTGNTTANTITIKRDGQLNVEGVLQANGDITNDGKLVFTSNATSTGQLDAFTANITKDVEVQRYIPAGRGFRLLTSAVTTSSSINANWQEGQNNAGITFPGDNQNINPGFGTHITGSTTGANGFDATPSGNYSIFSFTNLQEDQTSVTAWEAVANTDVNTLTAGNPLRMFVRGDRGINVTNNDAIANATVLRAQGNLHTGDYSPTISAFGGNFNFVGNPYQAAVDFNALTITGDLNTNYIYVWDAQLNIRGGYATITTLDGSNTVSSNANQFIQPGQAFFIRNNETVTIAPSITFTEVSKQVDQEQLSPFSTSSVAKLNVQLFSTDGDEQLADGIGFRFNENFNAGVDDADAGKLANAGENFAIVNSNQLLSIEQREWPNQVEEVQLFINSYESENYSFKLQQENINEGLEIYIKDNYLDTQTLIDTENDFSFSIDPSISDSSSMFRFSLVFGDVSLSNEDFEEMDFQIYPNPTKNGAFTIRSNGLNGQEVQVTIYNLLGQEVFSKSLMIRTNGQVNIEASDLSSGLYIVELKQEEKRFTRKLIVD